MLDKGIFEAIKRLDLSVLENFFETEGVRNLKDFVKDTIDNKEKYIDDHFYTSSVRDFLIYLFGFGKEEDLSTYLYDLARFYPSKDYADCMYTIILLELASDLSNDIPWVCYFDEVFGHNIIETTSKVLEESIRAVILELVEEFRDNVRKNLGF